MPKVPERLKNPAPPDSDSRESDSSRTPKLSSEKTTPDTTFRKSGFTDDAASEAPLPFVESEGRAL
jgi:hypothetical protein